MRLPEDSDELFERCERQRDRMRVQQETISRQRRKVINWALAGVEPPPGDDPAEVEKVVRELLRTV